jgi:TATA-binding protein-associated factor Taf7
VNNYIIYSDEEWKELNIEDYGIIKVSNYGNVKNNEDKYFDLCITTQGYIDVNILSMTKNIYKHFPVHQLVLLAFKGKKEGYIPNHINGIKNDNRLINLEYATISQNTQHAFDTGLIDINKSRRCKAVIQYDDKENEIARFPSMSEAARKTSISRECIKQACKSNELGYFENTRHKAGDFIWRSQK